MVRHTELIKCFIFQPSPCVLFFNLAHVAELDKRVGWSSEGCKIESRMLPQVNFYIIFCCSHFFLVLTKGNILKLPEKSQYNAFSTIRYILLTNESWALWPFGPVFLFHTLNIFLNKNLNDAASRRVCIKVSLSSISIYLWFSASLTIFKTSLMTH